MAAVKQLIRAMGLPPGEVDNLTEAMLSNPQSALYQELSLAMRTYLLDSRKAEQDEISKGGKIVVRVPYSVDIVEMRLLEDDYPEFKVEFHRRDKLMTGVGAARWYLETQAMFHNLSGHKESVIYLSDTIEHVVIRNRHYVHSCMSESTPEAQVGAKASHRAISAFGSRTSRIAGSSTTKPVVTPVLPNEAYRVWAKHDGESYCLHRERCSRQAPVVLMDYSQYGLCWEQHAMTLDAHGSRKAHSMVPFDDMILAQADGYSEALGAWILFDTSDDEVPAFTINYECDYLKSRRYDYAAYKHFLHTSSIRYKGKTYHREFTDQRPGYLSCVTNVIDSEIVVDNDPGLNRLSYSPEFSRMTAVVSYVLKDDKLNPLIRRNYRRDVLHVDKKTRDRVMQSARGLDVRSFTESKVIEQARVHMTRAVVLAGTKFIRGDPLHERVLQRLAHVIYVKVWDERHSNMMVGSRLKHDFLCKRNNSEKGLGGLLLAYVGRSIRDGATKAYDSISLSDSYETWRERILRIESQGQLLPYFEDAYDFVEIRSDTYIQDYKPFSGSYGHFERSLKGGVLSKYPTMEEAIVSTSAGQKWMEFKVSENLRKASEGAQAFDRPEHQARVLYEEAPAKIAKTVPVEAMPIYDTLLKLNDVTGMLSTEDSPGLQMEDLSLEDEDVSAETTAFFPNPLNMLQDLSNEFGHSEAMTREYDEMLLHEADLSISVAPNRLEVTEAAVVAPKPKEVFRPKLVTSAPPKALQSTEQTLISLSSRNMDTPLIYEPMDPRLVWDTMVKPALDEYLGEPGLRKVAEYRENPVMRDAKNVGDWLATREPETFKALANAEFDPTDVDISKYRLILKDVRKPQLTKGTAATLKPPQTVNYHEKEVVAMWSPEMRHLAKRFEALVSHKATVSMLKSPAELIDSMNRHMAAFDPADLHVTALDHSQYDKSQARVAKYCEMRFYVEYLGMEQELCEEWFEGQYAAELSSTAVGVRLIIEMQRRTGDATTALGNTVLNMLSFVTMFAGWNSDVLFDGFMGDDMVRFSKKEIPNLDLEQRMNSVFNFSVKEIRSSVAYYLSGFIIKVGGKWLWVPDITKAMIRMGDPLHCTEELIKDRWISFKDRMSVFKNDTVAEAAAVAASRWYMIDVGVLHLAAAALWSCAKDYESFRFCWEKEKYKLAI